MRRSSIHTATVSRPRRAYLVITPGDYMTDLSMLLSNTPMRRGCLQKAGTVAHARTRSTSAFMLEIILTRSMHASSTALALAVHRRALVRRIGLLTYHGWAQRIIDACSITHRPAASHTADIDLSAPTSFFPTTRSVAATTACTCPVLEHLALLFFFSFVLLFS